MSTERFLYVRHKPTRGMCQAVPSTLLIQIKDIISTNTCHLVTRRVPLFATPWTDPIAGQAPLSTGSPGKNTAVVCRARLQGIFPAQG